MNLRPKAYEAIALIYQAIVPIGWNQLPGFQLPEQLTRLLGRMTTTPKSEQADRIAELEHALQVARATNRRLNERANAVPQWRKLESMTKWQRTGRFFPALMRLALTEATEDVERLQKELDEAHKLNAEAIRTIQRYKHELKMANFEIGRIKAHLDLMVGVNSAYVNDDQNHGTHQELAQQRDQWRDVAEGLALAARFSTDAINAEKYLAVFEKLKGEQ